MTKHRHKFLLVLFLFLFNATTYGQVIVTIAGGNGAGFSGDGGNATTAKIHDPYFIAIDDSGNLFISDVQNYRIRKVYTSGVIKTVCGNGSGGYSGDGGYAIHAEINGVTDIAFRNGEVFIADRAAIRKIDEDGVITTIAGSGTPGFSGDGGPSTSAKLNNPTGIDFDHNGNLFIKDALNHRIRKIDPSGIITTVAGTGIEGFTQDGSRCDSMRLCDGGGNLRVSKTGEIYFLDSIRIRKINNAGIVTTVVGNGMAGYGGDGGPATTAMISGGGIDLDTSDHLYIADIDNNRVRKINAESVVTTIAGNGIAGYSGDGGNPSSATLSFPSSVAVSNTGNIYISDLNNQAIRKIIIDALVASDNIIFKNGTLEIFPNPNCGTFSFVIETGISEYVPLTISTLDGTIKKSINVLTNKKTQIDCDISPGQYIVTVILNSEKKSQKITITN